MAATMLACSPHHDLPPLPSSTLDSGTSPIAEPPYPKVETYGARVGDVIPDLHFEGYRARSDVWEPVSIHDFYDPTGEKGIRYVLIISAAAWCPGCRAAAGALAAVYDDYEPKGVRFVHLMRESETTAPATKATVDRWRDNYVITYDNLLDDKQQSFSLQPAELRSTPYISIVDARTMKVLKAQIFPQTEDEPPTIPDLDELL